MIFITKMIFINLICWWILKKSIYYYFNTLKFVEMSTFLEYMLI